MGRGYRLVPTLHDQAGDDGVPSDSRDFMMGDITPSNYPDSLAVNSVRNF